MANKHWENPEAVAYGRLPARAHFAVWESAEAARDGNGSRELPLDGSWDFLRVARPDEAPVDWFARGFDTTTWRRVQVPSLWTRDEASPDKPIYTNVIMPFRAEPPNVPMANPTGLYRREFNLPETWLGQRTIIWLGGIENCYYLYCNGVEVGFAKDCRLPSEFDLTDYLQPGNNMVAIKVLHWSDASYIEDQDQWWHAGIHRSIRLLSRPPVYIRDIYCKPTLDPENNQGRLDVEVRLRDDNRNSLDHRVEIELLDPEGESVLGVTPHASVEKSAFFPVLGEGPRLSMTANAGRVMPWSAETPRLYTLLVTLLGPAGNALEATRVRVGFRQIEIRDRELLVNGQPVLIKGVNRHDHCDKTGKVMTEALMRKDIEVMKRHNINAVRTSHYPNDSRFYELCDEYGLYVVDECNIEAHHHYHQLGSDPAWATAFLNRVVRMVERDKNHASIIAWSMGNETGFGPHHAAMAAWVRQYDPGRPIHNENAICDQGVRSMWDENLHGSDLVCPMYPSVDDIVSHAVNSSDPRPLVMCEYAHAMGNSCGNLKEYWDAIERYKGLQGGFIWEWLDHGLSASANGIPYWAYGGDFGEDRHDLNFVCDGLCWPDRTPHSSLIEYKKIIQPVRISRVRGGAFRVHNNNWFTDFDQYTLDWELLRNGETVLEGKIGRVAVPPRSSTDINLDYELPPLKPGETASMVFHVRLGAQTPWAEAGHEVAFEQIDLGSRAPRRRAKRGAKDVTVTRKGTDLLIEIGTSRFAFSGNGWHSWQRDSTPVLLMGPALNAWRAPLDNDGIKGRADQDGKPLGRWRKLGIDNLVLSSSEIDTRRADTGGVIVDIHQTWGSHGGEIAFRSTYHVLTGDSVLARHDFDVDDGLADLPRLGVRLQLPPGFEHFSWFGRGPHETYVDRKQSGVNRVHSSSVTAQYVPYILPQDHGNLTDVRWLALADDTTRLHIQAEKLIEASASHFPHEMLTPAMHTYEITSQPETWVSLDVMQRGVGGASCGPDTLPQYRLGAGRHTLAYTLAVSPRDRR